MLRANLLIAIGTLLIALGGLVATYGWDMRSSMDTRRMLNERAETDRAQRRAALIRALGAECLVNTHLLETPPIDEQDPELVTKYVPYPRMHTTALTSAIASGAFASAWDREIFTSIVQIQEHLNEFNDRLNMTETQMTQGHVEMWRTTLRDGAALDTVRVRLKRFLDLLVRNGLDPNERLLDPFSRL
jgi:hypothetical protein